MFEDSLTLSPVHNDPEAPSGEQDTNSSASHHRPNDRCCAVHTALLSLVTPKPAGHTSLAVFESVGATVS